MQLAVRKKESEFVSMHLTTASGCWILRKSLLKKFKSGYSCARHSEQTKPDRAKEVAGPYLLMQRGEDALYHSEDILILILEAWEETGDESVETNNDLSAKLGEYFLKES